MVFTNGFHENSMAEVFHFWPCSSPSRYLGDRHFMPQSLPDRQAGAPKALVAKMGLVFA